MAPKPKAPKPILKTAKAKTGKSISPGTFSAGGALAMTPPPTPAELDARQSATKLVRKAPGPARKSAAKKLIEAVAVEPISLSIK